MSFVPVMWITWGSLVVLSLVLNVFKGRLERDEEDMLFLDDTMPNAKAHQAELVANVNRFAPILKTSIGITALWSLVVGGYYLRDIYVQLFGK